MEGVELEPFAYSIVHLLGQRLVHLLVEVGGAGWGRGFLLGFQRRKLLLVKVPAGLAPLGIQKGIGGILPQGDGMARLVVDAVAEAGHLAALVMGGGEGGELGDGFGRRRAVARVHRQQAELIGGRLSGDPEFLPVVHAHAAQLQGLGPVAVVDVVLSAGDNRGIGKDKLGVRAAQGLHAGHRGVLRRQLHIGERRGGAALAFLVLGEEFFAPVGEIPVVQVEGSSLLSAAGGAGEAPGFGVYAVGFQVHGGIGVDGAAGVPAREARQADGGVFLGRRGGQPPHGVGRSDLAGVAARQAAYERLPVVGGVHMQIGGFRGGILDEAPVLPAQAADVDGGGVDAGGEVHAVHGAVEHFAGEAVLPRQGPQIGGQLVAGENDVPGGGQGFRGLLLPAVGA